jgi:hypothetical protein
MDALKANGQMKVKRIVLPKYTNKEYIKAQINTIQTVFNI